MESYVNDFAPSVLTYYKELKKTKPLSKEVERELIIKAKNNDARARDKLLTSNLKFVFDVAKKYKGKGVSIDDLIEEGNAGLIKAFDKFDTSRDVKFISYAVWWIRQSIQDCIKKNIAKCSIETSSDEEMCSVDDGHYMFDSEDEYVSNTDVMLPDTEEQDRIELNNNQRKVVKALLSKLPNRSRFIVAEYYGLNGKEKNLGEIGDILGLSKERVRQIKMAALKALKKEILLNGYQKILTM